MLGTAARRLAQVILIVSSVSLAGTAYAADTIKGQVLVGRAPVAKSEVTVWEASPAAPKKLGETKTNDDGRFEVRAGGVHSDSVIYLTANGGQPKASNAGGDNDVWIGNFWGRSVVLMAGDGTKGHPAGTKTGDTIHVFQGGSIQMLTDVSIDPAGNVWAANNWNSLNGAASPDPSRPTSTWGCGSGLTVIYGVAAPVKPPRMGKVQTF